MQRRRFQALRTAAFLAAGFVVLRIVYRIVFGGAGGNGVVLLDPPGIPLAGPFRYITLLGPVTSGGLASAAASALPFAALVLAFGVFATVIDLRRLLTRAAVRGPVRTVARALVIAWATFPALLDSVRRVSSARELRGERAAASLVVPVLELTVERAIVLGASMELRGFAAARQAEPVSGAAVVAVSGALGFGDRRVLDGIDLVVEGGMLTLLTGATGSGKSMLLNSMSGLFQHVQDGVQSGVVCIAGVDRAAVPPRETAGIVGVVAQAVRMSFVAESVADELAFALEIRDVTPRETGMRVAAVAELLGITHLLDRGIVALSAGEACLVAIGAALITEPLLLLLDEPLADLDSSARERVVAVLDRLAHESGVCVIVAEHALGAWGGTVDTRLHLADGTVTRVVPPWRDAIDSVLRPEPAEPDAERVASIRNLSVRYGDRLAVDDAGFDLRAGELVALAGPNGAGKSSLLRELARPRSAGTVTVAGQDVHALRARSRRAAVALVPEAADDLLFATSVSDECQRAGRSTAELFERLVGSTDLLERHPRDLSAGQRLCLVIAIQLARRPRVLLIDEPSRGLDADARRLVGEALVDVAAFGAAVVIATHDSAFADRYTSRTLTMRSGHVMAAIGVTS